MVKWWLRFTATHDHDLRILHWELFEEKKKKKRTFPPKKTGMCLYCAFSNSNMMLTPSSTETGCL